MQPRTQGSFQERGSPGLWFRVMCSMSRRTFRVDRFFGLGDCQEHRCAECFDVCAKSFENGDVMSVANRRSMLST